jgi:hypothetical protein
MAHLGNNRINIFIVIPQLLVHLEYTIYEDIKELIIILSCSKTPIYKEIGKLFHHRYVPDK